MSTNDAFMKAVEGEFDSVTLDSLRAVAEQYKELQRPTIEFRCANGEYERASSWIRTVFDERRPDKDVTYSPPELGGRLSITAAFAGIPFVINESFAAVPGYIYLIVNGAFQMRTRME